MKKINLKKSHLIFSSIFFISILILILNTTMALKNSYNSLFETIAVTGVIFSLFGISFKFFYE